MIVYLAGPIDSVPLDGGAEIRTRDMRAQCITAARKLGCSVYDPASAYPLAADPEGVVAVNRAAMLAADAVLAFLPEGVRSVGTPIEIADAQRLGKPLAVIHEGTPGVQLRGMGVRLYGIASVEQALGDLAKGRGRGWGGEEVVVDRPQWLTEGQLSLEDEVDDEEILLQWTGGGERPAQGHPGDAGLDLTCSESQIVMGRSFSDIPCDVSVAFPEGVWGLIVGRSSTLRKKGLLVAQGIIDQGYRGELFCGVWNLREEPTRISQGERLAQLIPMPLLTDRCVLEMVDELPASPRGRNGFGSTGS